MMGGIPPQGAYQGFEDPTHAWQKRLMMLKQQQGGMPGQPQPGQPQPEQGGMPGMGFLQMLQQQGMGGGLMGLMGNGMGMGGQGGGIPGMGLMGSGRK